MIILLNSSKTMRFLSSGKSPLRQPLFIDKSQRLGNYLKKLSPLQLAKAMKISPALAEKTAALLASWTADQKNQSCAIDSFLGDIYSGLQAQNFSKEDRDYADSVLFILSGLYGIIRPKDGISPYRLEMEYKFPKPEFANLYQFWGRSIANSLPKKRWIVNLASEEFSRMVTPFVETSRVISPNFLTVHPKTLKPTFVAVHAKIARGAFARWLIVERVRDVLAFSKFRELGYSFDQTLSEPNTPTFVCKFFDGKGLSLKKLRT